MKLLANIRDRIPLLPKPRKKPLDIIKNNKYIVLAAVMLLFVVLYDPKPQEINDNKIPVVLNGTTIKAEVAENTAEIRKGLMYRNELPKNEGMLFVLSFEGKHSFWMKNTLIPLDMVWINSQKEVVHIDHSAPPCRRDPCPGYRTPYPAKYVLELNGGWSIENGLNLGDQVSFSLQ